MGQNQRKGQVERRNLGAATQRGQGVQGQKNCGSPRIGPKNPGRIGHRGMPNDAHKGTEHQKRHRVKQQNHRRLLHHPEPTQGIEILEIRNQQKTQPKSKCHQEDIDGKNCPT